jgi:hypothetical protein
LTVEFSQHIGKRHTNVKHLANVKLSLREFAKPAHLPKFKNTSEGSITRFQPMNKATMAHSWSF